MNDIMIMVEGCDIPNMTIDELRKIPELKEMFTQIDREIKIDEIINEHTNNTN